MPKTFLRDKILLLDGALGTELQRRGVPLPLPLWSAEANLTHPLIVASIHHDYVSAGADICTTNTFRTTTWTYHKGGYSLRSARQRARESLLRAVALARDAGYPKTVIAGSIAPLEDCYQPEDFPGGTIAQEIFEETMNWFQEGGVDLLLLETMGNIEEITVVLRVMSGFSTPVWLSLILKDEYHLLDGTPLEKVFLLAVREEVDTVLLNCNSLELTQRGINTLQLHWSGTWGVYPNLGATPIKPDGTITSLVSMKGFQQYSQDFVKAGTSVLGTCCGSNPDHTRLLKRLTESNTG